MFKGEVTNLQDSLFVNTLGQAVRELRMKGRSSKISDPLYFPLAQLVKALHFDCDYRGSSPRGEGAFLDHDFYAGTVKRKMTSRKDSTNVY